MAIDAAKDLTKREPAGLGRPLRVPVFRNLLIADLVSDIGAFMQNVGAAWLMVSLHAGPGYVALIQTAASLPYFSHALGSTLPMLFPDSSPIATRGQCMKVLMLKHHVFTPIDSYCVNKPCIVALNWRASPSAS